MKTIALLSVLCGALSEWDLVPTDACQGSTDYLQCVLDAEADFTLTYNELLPSNKGTVCGSQTTHEAAWSDKYVLGSSVELHLKGLVIDGVEQAGALCTPYVYVVGENDTACPNALPTEKASAEGSTVTYTVDVSTLNLDSSKPYTFVIDMFDCDPGASAYLSYSLDVKAGNNDNNPSSTSEADGDSAGAVALVTALGVATMVLL